MGFVAVSKTMAGVGRLKRICKHACAVAGAVGKTYPLDSDDFLRAVAFCKIRSSFSLVRRFCMDGAVFRMILTHYFVAGAVLLIHGVEKSQKTLAQGRLSQALNFPFLKTSRRLASFLMLSNSNIEEVSQNFFVLELRPFIFWGSLAHLDRFGHVNFHF